MRKALVIISSLLLIASFCGLYKAHSLPTETQVEKKTTLLSYEHEGKLAPRFYVKPSYFYSNSPLSQANPKYPAKLIDSFEMTFIYDAPTQASQEVEVSGVLENPGVWQKEVVLVPKTNKVGDFTLAFPLRLEYFQSVAETIDKEIGVGTRSHELSIRAVVHSEGNRGQIGGDFVQVLPVKFGGDFVEVDRNLTKRWGDSLGKFDYIVHLLPNSLFDSPTLTPPPSPFPEVRGAEDTIFSSLVDGMDIRFCYQFKSAEPIAGVNEEVRIDAMAENPGKWSKTFVLVPPTRMSGDFSLIVPLDLEQISQVFDIIKAETGVAAKDRSVIIKASVHTRAETEFGAIDEVFKQSINANLAASEFEWGGDGEKSEPGSIAKTEFVSQENTYLGLPVARLRNLFLVAVGIIYALFLFSLVRYIRWSPKEATAIEREVRRAAKKYKDVIVNIREVPAVKPGERVISLGSLGELVKAAEGLLKPVLHKEEGGKHVYCVLDDSIRYQCLLGAGPEEQVLPIFNGSNEDSQAYNPPPTR